MTDKKANNPLDDLTDIDLERLRADFTKALNQKDAQPLPGLVGFGITRPIPAGILDVLPPQLRSFINLVLLHENIDKLKETVHAKVDDIEKEIDTFLNGRYLSTKLALAKFIPAFVIESHLKKPFKSAEKFAGKKIVQDPPTPEELAAKLKSLSDEQLDMAERSLTATINNTLSILPERSREACKDLIAVSIEDDTKALFERIKASSEDEVVAMIKDYQEGFPYKEVAKALKNLVNSLSVGSLRAVADVFNAAAKGSTDFVVEKLAETVVDAINKSESDPMKSLEIIQDGMEDLGEGLKKPLQDLEDALVEQGMVPETNILIPIDNHARKTLGLGR